MFISGKEARFGASGAGKPRRLELTMRRCCLLGLIEGVGTGGCGCLGMFLWTSQAEAVNVQKLLGGW